MEQSLFLPKPVIPSHTYGEAKGNRYADIETYVAPFRETGLKDETIRNSIM